MFENGVMTEKDSVHGFRLGQLQGDSKIVRCADGRHSEGIHTQEERLCAADGQVDSWVFVRTDKWCGNEKAWPMWSFVTRAYAGDIDRDLSLDTTRAEISTDVSYVQLAGVQLNIVLIILCMRRALDCALLQCTTGA